MQATVKAESDEITIGSPLRLSIKVEHEKGDIIEPFSLKDKQLGEWEVLEVMPANAQPNHFSQQISLIAWDSGNIEIPVIALRCKRGDSTQIAYTSPLNIHVNLVPVDTTKAIKAIQAPIATNWMWQEMIPYLVITLSLILMTLLSLFWWRYRKQKTLINTKPVDTKTLRETALERLENLEKARLWQSGEVKMYYTRLSDIVRVYIEKRFQILASDITTKEILDLLSSHINTQQQQQLRYILDLSDEVKFAKSQPLPSESAKVMEMAKDWLKTV